jgi:hypothetical protein
LIWASGGKLDREEREVYKNDWELGVEVVGEVWIWI